MARCASDSCSRWRPDVVASVWGATIDDRWFCSQSCVEQMLRRLLAEVPAPQAPPTVPGPPHLRLGALLRHHGALSADQLHHGLDVGRRRAAATAYQAGTGTYTLEDTGGKVGG